ncbi:MAG: ribosome silencing factor [Deltaproteobacteria bacterium]|nr:ribosome silencing factor [Deltaproteobacteria bacterium]MBW2122252.1 ribosome silencing factor [Deltaproteobacteria bacterium]
MAESSKKKSLTCVDAALQKKAVDVVLLKIRGIVSYADYFLICGGRSDRQVQAIAESIETEMKKRGHRALGIEGMSQGRWVLIDYGDVVVHVFQESVRKFYDLEGLWIEAPRVDLADRLEPGKTGKKAKG